MLPSKTDPGGVWTLGRQFLSRVSRGLDRGNDAWGRRKAWQKIQGSVRSAERHLASVVGPFGVDQVEFWNPPLVILEQVGQWQGGELTG